MGLASPIVDSADADRRVALDWRLWHMLAMYSGGP